MGGEQEKPSRSLGQLIVEHPKISHIAFTGSAATGKKVMQAASATLKKVTPVLGGNDPAVALPDVNPAVALPELAKLDNSFGRGSEDLPEVKFSLALRKGWNFYAQVTGLMATTWVGSIWAFMARWRPGGRGEEGLHFKE